MQLWFGQEVEEVLRSGAVRLGPALRGTPWVGPNAAGHTEVGPNAAGHTAGPARRVFSIS